MKKMLRSFFEHPFRFRLEGKVIENDRVEIEDVDIGWFWILVFLLIIF